MFELANPGRKRARKGARLVAEKLAFDERGRQRGAVHGDEGARGAGRQVVQRARDEVLAGPGLADDEHVGLGGADGADAAAQVDHRGRPAHQPRLEVVGLPRRRAQEPVLEHQPAVVGRACDDLGQCEAGKGFSTKS
jgi:hypothetical protein